MPIQQRTKSTHAFDFQKNDADRLLQSDISQMSKWLLALYEMLFRQRDDATVKRSISERKIDIKEDIQT